MKVLLTITFFAVQILGLYAQPSQSEFGFRPPAGWREFTLERSQIEQLDVPPAVATILRQQRYLFMAVAPDVARDNCSPNVNAALLPAFHVTNRRLQQVARVVQERARAAGIQMTIRETNVLERDGVNLGVLDSETTLGVCPFRQMMFVIPGRQNNAVMTFSARSNEFEGYRRLFEESAFSTTGAAEGGFRERLAAGLLLDNSGDRDYAIGTTVGLSIGLAPIWYFRRRRKM